MWNLCSADRMLKALTHCCRIVAGDGVQCPCAGYDEEWYRTKHCMDIS